MMYLFIIASSIAVIFVSILPLFFKRNKKVIVERDAVNIKSAANRLSDLKQALENREITEDEFQSFRQELEISALEDLRTNKSVTTDTNKGNKILVAIVVLLVPLFVIFTYKKIGNEEALLGQAPSQEDNVKHIDDELEKILATVEADVKNKPDNVEGRIALGQAYVAMERYGQAEAIYKEAYELRPQEPDILVNYAEAMARSHGNRLSGRPAELLNDALKIEPSHKRALWLAGFAEIQGNNKQQAILYWRKLLSGLDTDSEMFKQVQKTLQDLESW